MTAIRRPIPVLLAACLMAAPYPVAATAIANSTLQFDNLRITPALGTFALAGPWFLETFGQADNSLGGTAADFASASSPDSIGAAASVAWAGASGSVAALDEPPSLVAVGAGSSDVNVPGCGPAFGSSKGRSTLYNSFTLSESGSVQFDIDISGLLSVITDVCGVEAMTEVVFSLAIDGAEPLLFFTSSQSIGRSDSALQSFATTLTNTVSLGAGPYAILLEADSESRGRVEVPAPSSGLLLLAALATLARVRRCPTRFWSIT